MAVALSIFYLVSSFLDKKKRVENDRSKKREKQLRMMPTAERNRDDCKSYCHYVLYFQEIIIIDYTLI